MITVACVWYKNWPDQDKELGQQYVNKLYRSLKRNTTIDFDFVCLTDNPVAEFENGVRRLFCDFSLCSHGQLGKLMLYNSSNGFQGRVIGMDLDTMILSNIDDFLLVDEPFVVRKAFKNVPSLKQIGGDMVSFIPEQFYRFWNEISCTKLSTMKYDLEGSERKFYSYMLREDQITFWQDLFLGRYISYKKHYKQMTEKNRSSALMKASLISFHGRPRPHEVHDELLQQYWHEV